MTGKRPGVDFDPRVVRRRGGGDVAYTLGVNDRIGSIESGKFADFVVLEEDPRDVDPTKIKDIGVVATIHAGNVTLTSATRDPDWK